MTTSAELADRRNMVWELKLMGFTLNAIGEKLDISKATAYRDMTVVIKELSVKYKSKDEITAEALSNTQKIIEKSWRMFNKKEQTENIQLRCMDRINKAVDKLIIMAGVTRNFKVETVDVNVRDIFDIYQKIKNKREEEKTEVEIEIEKC